MKRLGLALLLLGGVAHAQSTASPTPPPAAGGAMLPGAPGGAGLDPKELSDALVSALEKTEAKADADIASEVVDGGYRIGLVLGPGRAIRPRTVGLHFAEPSTSDPDITFVGVVVREARTKRFLPAADVKVILEYEGGSDVALDELIGAYPVYGKNLRLPPKGTPKEKAIRAISVVVGPPAYARHAEMLAAYTTQGTARFELKERAGKGIPDYEVVDAKKPAPVPEDWKMGSDLRQAVGEARAFVRDGEYAIGFIAEGPESIWLWEGAQAPPKHCPPAANDTNHFEAVVLHIPTGLNVTNASVAMRFWRRVNRQSPPEQHDFLLHPLLADFYHYGLTTAVPAGTWVVQVAVNPPGIAAWGNEPHPPAPEERLQGVFQFTRTAPVASGPAGEAQGFAARLEAAMTAYQGGDRSGAAKTVTDAFFAFEGSELDKLLRARDPGAYKSLETDWIAVRAKMEAGDDPAAVKAGIDGVAARLRALGAESGVPASGSSAFLQSFFVLLREGFEAILVLSLLVGVLRKTNKTDALRLVWGGALAGVAASLLLAAGASAIFRGMGAAREAFEGFTLLVSVLVLFFTSYWLISRVEGRRWAMFMKNQIEGAVSSGRRFAIASLAFLVVFREGAETVLFYAGLFASAHGAAAHILAGIGAGALALVGVFFVTMKGGAQLPVRPFFAVTGALLYLLAFKFAGDGFAELQAAGVVARTAVHWLPDSPALQAWLGIYPTAQTAAAQGVLVLAVVLGLVWTRVARPESDQPAGGAVAG